MTKKKVLSPMILLLLTLTLLSAFNLNTTKVAAGVYPSIYINPVVDPNLTQGKSFTVSIETDYTGDNVTGWQFTLSWDPSILECISVTNGGLIPVGPAENRSPEYFINQGIWDPAYWNLASGHYNPGDINNNAGTLSLTSAYFDFTAEPTPVVSGPETLANVTFKVKGYGHTYIKFGPETKLITYSDVRWGTDELDNYLYGGWGDKYDQIHAATMPNNIQHGYFENKLGVIYDVAVISVTPSPTEVYVNDTININVVVKNNGTEPETFDVKVYYDTIALPRLIETQTVTDLENGTTTPLSFTWDTTGVSVGDHSIITVASTLFSETDTENNKIPRPFTQPPTVKLIGPVLPWAAIRASEREWVNDAVAFNGSASFDPDGTIELYTWNFDDGTSAVTVTDPVIDHTFTTAGIFGVTLVVTDNDSLESVNPCVHAIEIAIKPLADLVNWKVKPEANRWSYSNDLATDDGLLTLTALARNLATDPINAKITFAILDARFIGLIDIFVEPLTLEVSGEIVPVTVDLDPEDYGWDPDTNPRVVLYAHVTFEYYHPTYEDWIPTSTKIVRFSINP